MKQHDHLAFAMDFVIEPEAVHLFKWHAVLLELSCVPFSGPWQSYTMSGTRKVIKYIVRELNLARRLSFVL
jgi:hypothetical protein